MLTWVFPPGPWGERRLKQNKTKQKPARELARFSTRRKLSESPASEPRIRNRHSTSRPTQKGTGPASAFISTILSSHATDNAWPGSCDRVLVQASTQTARLEAAMSPETLPASGIQTSTSLQHRSRARSKGTTAPTTRSHKLRPCVRGIPLKTTNIPEPRPMHPQDRNASTT